MKIKNNLLYKILTCFPHHIATSPIPFAFRAISLRAVAFYGAFCFRHAVLLPSPSRACIGSVLPGEFPPVLWPLLTSVRYPSPDIQLPSDSASRQTPLPSAGAPCCQARSGLSPPGCCPCRAHHKKSSGKHPVVFLRTTFELSKEQ